jgi:quinol monooxygenase YgiN
MILSVIKIMPHPDKGHEVIDALLSIKGRTRVSSGCLECTLAQMENEDASTVLYIELWNSWEDLCCHIRSRTYGRILEALELSSIPPEVSFFQISSVKGMEVIEAERPDD